MRRRLLAAAALSALLCGVAVAPQALAADPVEPFSTVAPGGAAPSPETENQTIVPPSADAEASAIVNPTNGKPGDVVRVSGTSWPASAPVVVSTCGNRGIGGTASCAVDGAATFQADGGGTFSSVFTLREPPVSCPCVVHFTSPRTTQVVDVPVTLEGVAEGEVINNATDTRVSVTSKVSGAGPVLWGWFGGASERTLQVTLSNLGADVINNVQLNVAVGKGQDPTAQSSVFDAGTLQGGEVKTVDIPITLKGWSVGSYTIKTSLGNVTSIGEPARSTTSVYPWALIVLFWLALQPLLLGLYKRRPVIDDGTEDDPFAGSLFGPNAPFGPGAGASAPGLAFATAGAMAGAVTPVPATAYAAPVAGYDANGYAYDPNGYAYDPNGYAYAPNGANGYAGAAIVASAAVPHAGHDNGAAHQHLVPDYEPVFGVTDLRSYLDPAAPGGSTTVAPRIVVGGLPAPRAAYQPQQPDQAQQQGYPQQQGHQPQEPVQPPPVGP